MEKLLEQKKLKKSKRVFSGIKLPNYRKRNDTKMTLLILSVICTGQIYPWQVAPQQSLCPFQFDRTKVMIFFFEEKNKQKMVLNQKKSYLCKPNIGLSMNCKFISVLKYKSVNFF